MSKRFLLMIAFIAFVCCSIFYFGCTKKKNGEMIAHQSPEWTKNAVIFEIDLRSFSKAGSLKALEAQTPELKKLGITVLSLTPIHPLGELNRKGILGSPDAVKDFYEVNSEYGTLEDFKSLVSTSHHQGLKIIMNLVLSQAAWDSQLLMEHPDWFVHNEEGAIIAPNSERSDVALIDFNQHELRKYMMVMMKFWIREIGVDGFQCRSAELIPTDFWEIARRELDKIKPVLMISDSRLPEHHLKAFDMARSWDMEKSIKNIIDSIAPASIINDSMTLECVRYPKGSLHLRFNTDYNSDIKTSSPQVGKAAAILAFTLPGVPLLFGGKEAGKNELADKLYENLIVLRQKHPALVSGEYRHLSNADSASIFSFIRFSGKDSVIIVINFAQGKKDAEIQMPAGASLLWKNHFLGVSANIENSQMSVELLPSSFLVLVPSSAKEIL